jgi:molybdate transport system substrate-binding protein
MPARRRPGAVVTLLAFGLAACAAGPSGTPSVSTTPTAAGGLPTEPLTVFGAASLTSVLDDLRAAWESAAPGSRLTISTDSSATMAAQIELGAPADVFLSADTANPERLASAGLTAGPPVTFARNALTVITPEGNEAGIRSALDLGAPGVRVIAAGDPVPISKYVRQVVANLAALPGAPAGFAAAYVANVRSKEDNVRAVVAKIELGEGDAAIVYLTDAAIASRLVTVAIPDDANVVARYAGVVVAASPQRAAAAAFLGWLAGPAGQQILARYGFQAPG